MTRTTLKGWLMALLAGVSLSSANPALVPGVWKNITPPGAAGASYSNMAFDPSNPSILYTGFNFKGIWKSTDGGENWFALGISDPNIYDRVTPYLDDVSCIEVDPGDPNRLYVSKGVDGSDIGFWVSTDGGRNWVMPDGFANCPGGTTDVTAMSVDPTDFRHLLLGSHGCCEGIIMESKDGGSTWTAQKPGIGGGSFGLSILSYPAKGIGNGNTWLTISDQIRRTTDAGAHWSSTSSAGGVHGSAAMYYTKTGVLYAGGGEHLNRSTDNGITWQSIGPSGVFYTVGGDGVNLFACPEGGSTNYITSPENDGTQWAAYQGGTQKFSRSALGIRCDTTNGILYAGHWDAGLWALKVEGGTAVKSAQNIHRQKSLSMQRTASDIFTINGKLLGQATLQNRVNAIVDRRKAGRQAVVVKAK